MNCEDKAAALLRAAAEDAYSAARESVLRLAREGGAEIREGRTVPGGMFRAAHADPLAGIRAARVLEDAAARVARDYIRFAREDGASWQAIGEALGFTGELGDGPGVAAYEFVIARQGSPLGNATFGFTCGTCGSSITDYGPYPGNPGDCERGHAEGCARIDAAIWEDEEDEND